MSTSQNGWPVDRAGDRQDRGPLIRDITVPNGVLAGDVAVVFRWLAEQFDTRVERLVKGTCWGWFVKPIEGSSTISNHASGTAVDLNADQHPMGVAAAKTFSAKQITACHAIRDEAGGVLRWGGDYTGRPDPMHWEIVGTAAQVKALAYKIRTKEDNDMPTADEIAAATARKTWEYVLDSPALGVTGRPAGDWLKIAQAARNDLAAVSKSLTAAIGALAAKDQVDERALAAELAPGVAAAVLASLPASADDISQDEVTAAVEAAFARAFGSTASA